MSEISVGIKMLAWFSLGIGFLLISILVMFNSIKNTLANNYKTKFNNNSKSEMIMYGANKFKVLDSLSLGPKRKIIFVSAGEAKFVFSVSEKGIQSMPVSNEKINNFEQLSVRTPKLIEIHRSS